MTEKCVPALRARATRLARRLWSGKDGSRVVSEFLAMGGYAGYVWSAFGITALVLLGLLVQSWRAARRREAELAHLRETVRPARDERSVSRRAVRPQQSGLAAAGPGRPEK